MGNRKNRASGYYKVKLNGYWVVAEYVNFIDEQSHWYVCGNETKFNDNDFQEIGERITFKQLANG